MSRWLVLLLLACTLPASAETWRFGLIGDTPYSEGERIELPKMLAAMTDSPVDFIFHIGDIKNGQSPCDDAVLADRHALFNASRVPFIYLPGDNEWTDCRRVSNGSYDSLERLDKLRQLFWHEPYSLGQRRLPLERQPGDYPEHSRLRVGPVLFVTFNLPGDDNNYGPGEEPRPEFAARQPQVLAWLADSFDLARRERLAGIVLLFQANPGFANYSRGLPHRAYRDFLDELQRELANFAGQVVVVHGDTHISRVDHPLRDPDGQPLPRFTRVETFGYPLMGWTRGIIDTESPELFRFESTPWPAHKE
ncbi:MAG: hypothetical protein CVU18_10260 [Betaproteobacteria bacterium HGW-Betaproteobacteria-12]|nr:MAG: hypothetical protein CVU18_10260 [Betaproteobacteria bacterium HGW-Betaproteobacteria-12]